MASVTPSQRITPMLWYDDKAEEAVALYTSIFKNSKVLGTTRYSTKGANPSGRPPGSVMTVDFLLDGQRFSALNGGPHFTFNEAISLVVHCKDQQEVDYYWERLSAGGDPSSQVCGWLKDRFGVSWQVVPDLLLEVLTGPNPEKAHRALDAVLKMKKLDVAEIRRAIA